MNTGNFTQQMRVRSVVHSVSARVFDVMCVVAGALGASQVRFDDLAQGRTNAAFVAFAAALTLVMFPVCWTSMARGADARRSG